MDIPESVAASGAAARKTEELRLRVISALVLAGGILATTWFAGWPFRIVWAAVGGLVLYEWLTMMGRPVVSAALFGTGLLVLALIGVLHPQLMWAGFIGLMLCSLATSAPGQRQFAIYGVPYAAVIALVPPLLRDTADVGLGLIIWTFAVVWFTDIAAYFTGRALGGPKLAPRFSPNKTWSGAIGGACAGTACGALVWWGMSYFGVRPPLSLGLAVLVSLVASALGQVGDIAESAFKRHFKVKDSSQLIPGHGGFMDRLDAYWAVLAFAAIVFIFSSLVS